jgi:hypothetical protein
MSIGAEIAAAAASLVVEEGMEYAAAKRKAARACGVSGSRPQLPSDEEVEDAVREHIALFCAETQPVELQALREVAALWMQRLADFRPHVGGAVWRGTATALSTVRLDLYCDDPKSAQIRLINEGVDFDSGELPGHGREPLSVLTLASRSANLRDPVTVHLVLHDADDQRGALLRDARGQSWRGDLPALQRLMGKP